MTLQNNVGAAVRESDSKNTRIELVSQSQRKHYPSFISMKISTK